MNQFVVYEQLCELEDIARRYEAGKEYERLINDMQARIASELYRVAVIGEFKRGKSSLVNAIIGAQVLPTDILPMTAAVTRVTYGEERRIVIHYKDGREEERTVEELIDFATKFDAEKEKTAASIREIEVHYPSVLCKNHIDIIDTPGLNDNEAMTNVTLGVLGDIDAAMMVISANEPLSLTEQSLILNMIGKRHIRHIIFVVTHIDAVSSRPARQDAMIDFIRGRLCGEVLSKALEKWQGDEVQTQKARRILEKPDIFGVSSVLAMDGFIQDDEELLEQSRFPVFKRELLALLTAAQSMDVIEKTKDAARDVRRLLPGWQETELSDIAQKIDAKKGFIAACTQYLEGADAMLSALWTEAEEKINELGTDKGTLTGKYENALRAPFIRHLSAIRTQTNTTENIAQAISMGCAEALSLMESEHARVEEQMRGILSDAEEKFISARRGAGFGEAQAAFGVAVPGFAWAAEMFEEGANLCGVDVILRINGVIGASLAAYAQGLAQTAAQGKELLAAQNKADIEGKQPLLAAQAELDELETRDKVKRMQYEESAAELAKVLRVLEIEEAEA